MSSSLQAAHIDVRSPTSRLTTDMCKTPHCSFSGERHAGCGTHSMVSGGDQGIPELILARVGRPQSCAMLARARMSSELGTVRERMLMVGPLGLTGGARAFDALIKPPCCARFCTAHITFCDSELQHGRQSAGSSGLRAWPASLIL